MLYETIQRLMALADAGLFYGKDIYDLERYQEIKTLLPKLLEELTDMDKDQLAKAFPDIEGYPTPKVDTRAFILNDRKEILLVKEKRKGEWSLPGGYMDMGYSPSENVVKEVAEETGHTGEIVRLLAIFDTNKWQKQHFQFYKFCFYIRLTGGSFQENSETSEIGYFPLDKLPEKLSTNRNSKAQLAKLLELVETNQQHID